ncbi:lysine-specific histone demethylase 1 [Sporothrix schenckii 1099-18]|uniref:Lysine-specific histone demethylase 1 n=1 Tax=Sporothrix schenckii 1099-18 TaxID=1397361 RepID=A0A0F2M7S3_SPOSC|nr:lysine-specific histone demethylase 1 [Sporothrix schenckii 1099-18]KJR84875.1 lysine-specific histone demethylase 1 [Sporothrix schenckii 1099-18]
MDSITTLRVHDKVTVQDEPSTIEPSSTPGLPDKYGEHMFREVRNFVGETKESNLVLEKGLPDSLSQPLAPAVGNETTFHIRRGNLSNQHSSPSAAKVSQGEDTDTVSELAMTTQTDPGLPLGASNDNSQSAITTQTVPQITSLPATPQGKPETASKDDLSQKTELPFMDPGTSTIGLQTKASISGMEEFERRACDSTTRIQASLHTATTKLIGSILTVLVLLRSQNALASPVVRHVVLQEGVQTTALSSLSSHSHVSGPSSTFSEISSQYETPPDSNSAMPTAGPISSKAEAKPALQVPQCDCQGMNETQSNVQDAAAPKVLSGIQSDPDHLPHQCRTLSSSPKRVSVSRRPIFKIRPKSSIPSDLTPQEYAGQCIAAAESSRLNPYALHEEEHAMLRHHISHAQVTTYLNIRNGILRFWLRNPSTAVTRNDAMGCSRDRRWFRAAGVCFDWLVRRGYINFGCVKIKEPPKDKGAKASLLKSESMTSHSLHRQKKTIAIIGAGMAGLGCARQLDNLFKQHHDLLVSLGVDVPSIVVLEGRDRIGGRVYSRPFQVQTRHQHPDFHQSRCTAEMGGMIVTGFDRGNPMNTLIRGQLGLGYHALITATTIYDINGKPVDDVRDGLVENLFNECLDRVSEYKFKVPLPKGIEGNHSCMDDGRDNTSEGHPTIASIEDSEAVIPSTMAAAEIEVATWEQTTLLRYATPKAMEPPRHKKATLEEPYAIGRLPQADLVPVSSDRLTGRAHLEPGTHATLNAAHKLKSMGWSLKPGVLESRDLDLDPASKSPRATLGSVVEDAIRQYGELLDLNSQDYRLLNWHIANLEYSNAINHSRLSLKGWDIDAGNEWEGRHSMIIGGYQSVPRGLMLCPKPLDVRRQMAVKKIAINESGDDNRARHVKQDEQHKSPVIIEFENGDKFEADYVISTIPLGVLKHGNVEFDPPLPRWKSNAIDRLGYGVLNKIILTFRQPFWDTERDIFGVLREPANRYSLDQRQYSQRRGRMFQWFNISRTTGIPCLVALMAGDAAFDTEKASNDELVSEATSVLRCVFGAKNVPEPIEAVVTRWASDKFSRGSYSSAGPSMEIDDYDSMARPVGRHLHFAGEHTIGTHPATVHGAYLSGLRAASDIFEELVGPIDIPTPLVPPKETLTSVIKRKVALDEDEGKTGDESSSSISASGGRGSNTGEAKTNNRKRLEVRESHIQQHINSQIGDRPSQPPRGSESAYSLFSKANYERARKKCEEGRRPGKGRSTPNEVRVLTSKMWRSASAEERRPFANEAEAQKQMYEAALCEYNQMIAEWDQRASDLRVAYELEHPRTCEQDIEHTPQTLSPSVSDLVTGTPQRSSSISARRLRRTTNCQAGIDSDVEMSG